MKVAITGSSGLIGTALRKALTARGDTVVPVVRRTSATNEVRWDPNARMIDADALEGIDAVVNLSGASLGDKKWSPEQKKIILSSRIDLTAFLSETLAGLKKKPSVLISGSAIGFYGDRGDEALTEASDPGSGFLTQLCVNWEAATQAAEDAGIRVAHIRTGLVLSSDGGAVKETLLPFKLGLGGRVGDGKQYWSWISIDDHVAAILHIIDTESLRGPVNLTGPAPARNSDYTRAFGAAVGRPTILPTPTLALNLRLGAEAVDAMLMASAKVLPTALLESGFTFAHETVFDAFNDVLS